MFDGWASWVDEEDFQYIDSFTVSTLCRYSFGGQSFKNIDGKALKELFSTVNDKTIEHRVFKRIDPNKYDKLLTSFIKRAKEGLTLWNFLALKDSKTLGIFYQVIEHIPYWFDKSFREKYQGGTGIVTRPRVEYSLKNTFSKRQYYAIVYFVTIYWEDLGAAVQHRPQNIPNLDSDSLMLHEYYNQFANQHWYELAYIIVEEWEGNPIDFDLSKALADVDEFMVLSSLDTKLML